MKLCHKYSYSEQEYTNELEQIVRNIEANLDKFMSNVSSFPFLEATSSESVLIEAKRIGILSDSSHKAIVSLQKQESEKFIKSKAETISDSASKDNITSLGSKSIRPGKSGHFMNRFLLDWKVCSQCNCICCVNVDEMEAEVRHMADADWIYIYDLSKKQLSGETMDYAIYSASRALASLKSIPIAARRSMPVLFNSKGVLLSVPVCHLFFFFFSFLDLMCICYPSNAFYGTNKLSNSFSFRASASHVARIYWSLLFFVLGYRWVEDTARSCEPSLVNWITNCLDLLAHLRNI